MRRLVGLIIASVLLLGGSMGSAQAAAFVPKPMNIFNTPKAAGGSVAQQYGLDNYVMAGWGTMPRGSVARVAAFDITDERVAQKIIDVAKPCRINVAVGCGVNMRVIMDGTYFNPVEEKIKKALGNNVKANKSYAISCRYSCNSELVSIMHFKTYLMSSTVHNGKQTARQISITGTQNLTHTNMSVAWNQSQVLTDGNIYNAIASFFDQMRFDNDNEKVFKTALSKDGKFRIYMWPSGSASTDIYLSALRAIKNSECMNVKGGYGNAQHRTVIRVNIYHMTTARIGIANELVRLHKAGCDVAFIYVNNPGKATMSQLVIDTLFKNGVKTYDSRRDLNKDGLYDMHSHGKEMLINGMVYGRPNKVVWNGSANFTRNALTVGNEQVLRSDDDYTYDAFKRNFDLVQKWSVLDRTRPIVTLPVARDGRQRSGGYDDGEAETEYL